MSGFYLFLIYLLNENSNASFDGSASLPDRQIHPILSPPSDAILNDRFSLNFVWWEYLMPTALIFLKYLVNICGDDAESFESLVKDHIFVVQNLVLLGLNCILNHHVA